MFVCHANQLPHNRFRLYNIDSDVLVALIIWPSSWSRWSQQLFDNKTKNNFPMIAFIYIATKEPFGSDRLLIAMHTDTHTRARTHTVLLWLWCCAFRKWCKRPSLPLCIHFPRFIHFGRSHNACHVQADWDQHTIGLGIVEWSRYGWQK